MLIRPTLKAWLDANKSDYLERLRKDSPDAPDHYQQALYMALADDSLSVVEFEQLADADEPQRKEARPTMKKTPGNPTVDKMFEGREGGPNVLAPSAKFSSEKRIGKHAKTGEEIVISGKTVYTPSELDLAKMGVWFRHANKQPLAEWERDLLTEMVENDRFCGETADGSWMYPAKLTEPMRKTLLNDATSGGTAIMPEAWDNSVITFPLLHSELYPFVEQMEITRPIVETGAIGNPTVSWDYNEGTAIGLFDTTGLVSAISTNTHTLSVALTMGRDFMSDTPVAIGSILQQNIGQRFMEEMDSVILNGDGLTQPEGIDTAAGVTTVSTTNGNSGPPVVDDLLDLIATIPKQYRQQQWGFAFISNDTTYFRNRAVSVGGSGGNDQRLVYGMDVDNYNIFSRPWKIQQDLPNTKIILGALRKYRFYRRLGFALTTETGGEQLVRRNEMLIVGRARVGGQVMDSSAFAKITDAQS